MTTLHHAISHLYEYDFDPAHMTHLSQPYGGQVRRRYPTRNGAPDYLKTTPVHRQALPHGFAFIVKRLFDNQPGPILPVFQNTCYPPNQPSPRRSFAFGRAIADAIKTWDNSARVAIVASGGLGHFVVDEELDCCLLQALDRKDSDTAVPSARAAVLRHVGVIELGRLGRALQLTELRMELQAYVPVYRTLGGTGGSWAFARWQ
jgi:hypothetical protein